MYTPPSGNAANFNFTTTPYTPPVGNVTNFNFSNTTSGRRRTTLM